ncbi:MAG: radical SAM protein [Candidatus Heimdallarchaeota archaeon]|nr:radical SAM protein [Candidatus Heimdallarchaeota archaeon]
MPVSSIHILFTYECTRSCKHCFVYGSPSANAQFTIEQIKELLDQIKAIDTIDTIYFEGGEPFSQIELLLTSIQIADSKGFKIGIVSNGYWATTEEEARIILLELKKYNIVDLSISDDELHSHGHKFIAPKYAVKIAHELGLPVGVISIEEGDCDTSIERGKPILGGNIRLRGRAVETYGNSYKTRSFHTFTSCPHEDLVSPERVHIDALGNVQICQGIIIGNIWKTPLKTIFEQYDVSKHPICSHLHYGGPLQLGKKLGFHFEDKYIEECHLCYSIRKENIFEFPDHLQPHQVYGMSSSEY